MVRQQSRFLNLMEGYSDSVELYEESLNAAGTANQKFAIWQDSTQAKLEKFQATLQTIYQSSFDTGIIKDIITFGTKLLDLISKLQEQGNLLITVVGLLSTAFFMFSANAGSALIKMVGTTIPGAIGTMIAMFTSAELATAGLTKAVNVLNGAFQRFLPALIVTGLVYAIQKIIEFRNEVKKTEEEYLKSVETFNQSQSELDNIKNLKSEYDSLNSKVIKTNQEKQRLIQIQNELTSTFPNLKTKIDAEGNSLIEDNKQLEKNIELKEKSLSIQSDQLIRKFHLSGSETYQEIRIYKNEIESLQNNLKLYGEEYQRYAEEYNTLQEKMSNSIVSSKTYEEQKQRLEELSAEMQRVDKTMKGHEKTLTDTQKKMKEISDEYQAMVAAFLNQNKGFKELNSDLKTNLISTLEELGLTSSFVIENLTKTDLPVYMANISNAIKIFKENGNIDELNKSFDDFKNAVISIAPVLNITQEEAENLAQSFLKNIAPIESTKVAIKQLEIGIQQASLGIKGATTTIGNAFLNLGVAISQATIGILANFGAVLDGIKSLMDVPVAMDKIIGKLASEKGIKKGTYEYDFFASNIRSQYSDLSPALKVLAQAREDINKAKEEINNFTSDKSDGSSSKSFEKTFEVWKELLEAINREIETLKDQLDDVTSFEQKTEIYDQMILLLEKKQNLLLDISNTFDSSLKQAEQNLRSYIGKGLSESDFNKIMSGSTDTIEVDIKNEKIAKAIEDFKKLKDSAEGLKKEIQGIDDEIRDLSFTKFKINLSIEDSKVSDLKQEKENLRNEMSLLEKGSAEYIALLERENQINIESVNILKNKIALVQQELSSDKYNADQKKELIDILKQLKQEYINLQFSIKQQLASIADEIIQIYKNIYEKQKQAALNSLDEQMKAEEKRHKQTTDNLDDELKQFEDYINARINALDKEENEHDYNRELEKKQKAILETQKQIDVLSLDDSFEAKAKKAELAKQLAEQQDEITEYQHDHSIDLRKDNLKDQLDVYKKDVNAKKKAEDTKLNLEKDRLDKVKRETERYYDELINDERKFAQIKTDILNGNIDEVKNAFGSFKTFVNSNLEFIGNSITANLITKMEQAMAILQSYQSQSDSIPNVSDNSFSGGNTNTSGAKTGLVKPGMLLTEAAAIAGISVVYHPEDNTVTIGDLPTRFSPAGIGGTHLNAQNRIVIDEIENIKRLIKMAGGDVSKFHEGGIVGSKTSGFVDKFNKFFNTNANEHIIKAITDEILTPPKNIQKYLIPNMQKLIASATPQLQFAGGGGDVNYYMNVHIDKVENTEKGVDGFFKKINNGMSKLGK